MNTNTLKYIIVLILGLINSVSYGQSLLVTTDSSDYLEPDTSVLFLDEDVVIENTQEKSDSIESIAIAQDSMLVQIPTDSISQDSIIQAATTVNSDSSANNKVDLLDSLKMVALDTNLIDSSYSLLRDTVYWQSVDSLFGITSSFTVDPYGYDAAKLKDTVLIDLCSHSHGEEAEHDSLSCWSMPMDINHHITSDFGERRYRWHYGIDFRLTIGDTIRSVFDGVVRISKYNPGGYGYYVLVRHHNGLETIYGHLSKRIAQVGDVVKAGDVIGLGGNTGRSSGPHLHFEVRWKGDAVDPKYFYDFENMVMKDDIFSMDPAKFEYIREMRKKVYHRIRSGDTLSGLAQRYRTSVRQICRLNRISTRTTLRIGRTLRVR